MAKLTQAALRTAMANPGRYRDGDGLMLFVSAEGRASWVVRIQHRGKRRDYGLGSFSVVGLSEAREKARQTRRILREGGDPHAIGRPTKGMDRLFRETALALLKEKFTGKTREQALSRLERIAFPTLGKMQLQSIDADAIADTLRPFWLRVPEAALRTRELIIRVLRYGRPDGPLLEATLARAVSDRLPPQPARGNYAAMPYQHVPAFMARLKDKPGMGAFALRLGILTAVRPGEVRGATWEEIDLHSRVWTVPAERTKTKRKPNRVPLSPQAVDVIMEVAQWRLRGATLVFPNAAGRVLSDATVLKCLRDMGAPYTVHAMRSAFRDWAAENTDTELDIAGAALSHERGKVKGSYLRTDFLNKRRPLMDAWGKYVCGGTHNEGDGVVVPFSKAS